MSVSTSISRRRSRLRRPVGIAHGMPRAVAESRIVYGAWAALGISIIVYAAVGLAMHQPFHGGPRTLRYFDLQVYRGAAARVAHGVSLYGTPIHDGFGFTYPPFAALAMLPLAAGSLAVDEVIVTALNLTLLVWLIRRTLLLGSGGAASEARAPHDRRQAWAVAAGVAGAALWLEPVSVTLGYGQINLLVALLVVADLSRPDHARGQGVAIGIAAALKLTPLIFIPYLLLTGRRRAAALATTTFAASVGVAYLALGADAAQYWSRGLFLDSSRVGAAADTTNQSLRGAIARLGASAASGLVTELVVACVAAGVLVLAIRASRRGDEALGFSLAALGALLASPISWTHHWVIAVPAICLLGQRAYQRRSRSLMIAMAVVLAVGYSYGLEFAGPPDGTGGPAVFVARDLYVLTALGAIACAARLLMPRRDRRAEAG